ncbi:MAG: protease modulator HflK [Thermoanaerobaculia bacterium]
MTDEQPALPRHVVVIQSVSRRLYAKRALIMAGLIVIALLGFLSRGIRVVRNGQRGVLRRFGRVADGQVAPGLTYVVPFTERLDLVESGAVRTVAFGESLGFITGDENVVNVRGQIECRVDDTALFLTATAEPEKIIRSAAEQLVTRDIGWRNVDDVLTTDRSAIQETVWHGVQAAADRNHIGMTIIGVTLEAVTPPPEAADAFAAVADAASERERRINETEGKASQSLSFARAQANEERSSADASATEQTQRARSSAASFIALSEEARRARAATEQRLFRKAVERVLHDARVIILPGDGSREHLRLDLRHFTESAPAPEPGPP